MSDRAEHGAHDHHAVELYEEYTDTLPDYIQDKFDTGQRRYGDSWVDADPSDMMDRMEEEFYEYRQAVEKYQNQEKALEEMGDIVNYGLMCMAVAVAGESDE